MNFEEFRVYATSHTDEEIVQYLLFDEIPYCFKNDINSYREFRSDVCSKLSIHQQDFTIVGSAKVGFSLNPSKIGIEFNEASDIDIVLVSNEMFEYLWNRLVEYRKSNFYKLDEYHRQRFKELQNIIFYGQIRMDKLSNNFDYAKSWWEIFNALSIDKRYGPRLIRASLFKTWKYVSSYYENGISRIRGMI
jgi:hypothetical protein